MKKILHIWDQAGVACTLAKFQRRFGDRVHVIKREGFDPFKIIEFYGEEEIKSWLKNNFNRVATKKAKDYDIIHIHDVFQLVPIIRKNFKNKIIVLHYHGTILRNTPSYVRKISESLANRVLVSTPDLKQFVDASYLPNPVDTDHFASRNPKNNNKAISIMSDTENELDLVKKLKEHSIDINLDFKSRKEHPILYSDMPDFLSNYEYFVDLKLIYRGRPAPTFSMLGLQALSLGLKVINYEYKIKSGLPEEHKPETVSKQLSLIYENI